jgi:hypothetical protein
MFYPQKCHFGGIFLFNFNLENASIFIAELNYYKKELALRLKQWNLKKALGSEALK